MTSHVSVSLLLAVSLLVPQAAWAETDPDSIKKAIAGYLAETGGNIIEGGKITYDDLTVTAVGEAYDVVLKGLRVSAADGSVIDAGDTGFTVTGNGADFDISNVTLPNEIKISSGHADDETAVLTWTQKVVTGTWTPLLEEFKALDLEMAGVSLSIPEGRYQAIAASFGDLIASVATDVVSDRDWRSESRYRLGPITVEDSEGEGTLTLGAFEVFGEVANLNPQLYRQQLDILSQLEAAHEANDQAEIEDLKGQVLALGPFAQEGWGGIALTNLDFRHRADDKLRVTLEAASAVLRAAAPAGSETGSLGLTLSGNGLTYEIANPDEKDRLAALVVPNHWDLNMEVRQLPLEEATQVLTELVFSSIGIQDEPNIPFAQIRLAMGQAGSKLVIDELSLAGPYAALDGEAEITADPTSAMGAVGGGTLRLIGLHRLEEAIGDLQSGVQQEIAKALVFLRGGLVFLKGLGRPEPNGDAIDYLYVLDVPADGNFTLNGQPIGAMLPH
ncbi:MAG: hypothetical protein GDA41_04805 [Rhodospirillales bacterium]|nr:hypothetical protein [Rhodospirillales bacterium]